MFADSTDDFEGSAQECALQRLWSRRLTLTGGLLEDPEPTLLEDIFPAAGQEDDTGPEKCQQGSVRESEDNELPGDHREEREVPEERATPPKECWTRLDAALLGDIPACYVIPAVADDEYPVVGAWIDPRVVQGFRYRVKPLNHEESSPNDWLFGGRALTLLSIGRGYSRRLTFESDKKSLNNNGNYFWSDSRPEGFAFVLEVISPGDKFTLHDTDGEACATMEVVQVRRPQREVDQVVRPGGRVEKTVTIQTLAKVEWFEGQATVVLPVSGVATVARPGAGVAARLAAVAAVTLGVGHASRRGYTLTPGVHDRWRRTTVVGDVVKAKYTIVGLEPHELPVIGTYVDPRITPGFEYRVRPASSPRPLFSSLPLRLLGIGRGYAKRLTFSPTPGRLNEADNYMWSDNHPEGLGLEPRAVHVGMVFAVRAGDGRALGVATVFRADGAQQEVDVEVVKTPQGTAIVKHIHVDVTCHVALLTATPSVEEGGGELMRVSGRAVVSLPPGRRDARLVKIEDVGLDSQLNMLFIAQEAELVFYPM